MATHKLEWKSLKIHSNLYSLCIVILSIFHGISDIAFHLTDSTVTSRNSGPRNDDDDDDGVFLFRKSTKLRNFT